MSWNELPFHMPKEEEQEHDKTRESPEELGISPQDLRNLRARGYEIYKELGHGSFGRVYLGSHGATRCAVKMILPQFDQMYPMEDYIATELEELKHIKHPNVIKVYDLFITSGEQLLIFMELAEGGDLDHYLKKQVEPLSESLAKRFYRQFGDAFWFMHRLGIAHCDIKADNILLDKAQEVCKVSDFGLSLVAYDKRTGRATWSDGFRGTAHYVAPEVICNIPENETSTVYCPFKADVWSVGVLLYQMLNLQVPFEYKRKDPVTLELMADFEWMLFTQTKMIYMIKNEKISYEARVCICAHLEPKPEERPNFEMIFRQMPLLAN